MGSVEYCRTDLRRVKTVPSGLPPETAGGSEYVDKEGRETFEDETKQPSESGPS